MAAEEQKEPKRAPPLPTLDEWPLAKKQRCDRDDEDDAYDLRRWVPDEMTAMPPPWSSRSAIAIFDESMLPGPCTDIAKSGIRWLRMTPDEVANVASTHEYGVVAAILTACLVSDEPRQAAATAARRAMETVCESVPGFVLCSEFVSQDGFAVAASTWPQIPDVFLLVAASPEGHTSWFCVSANAATAVPLTSSPKTTQSQNHPR